MFSYWTVQLYVLSLITKSSLIDNQTILCTRICVSLYFSFLKWVPDNFLGCQLPDPVTPCSFELPIIDYVVILFAPKENRQMCVSSPNCYIKLFFLFLIEEIIFLESICKY
jgi:hypothetical protein